MVETKIYTGDDGKTGTLGPGRVRKSHLRIETLGALDEVSAFLGLARAQVEDAWVAGMIKEIQTHLYYVMTEVASPPNSNDRPSSFHAAHLEWIESKIAMVEDQVTLPAGFIIPGDSLNGAALSLARTVVRRAERWVTKLHFQGGLTNQCIIPYLNRLSFLCFLLEIYITRSLDIEPSLVGNQKNLPG